MEEKDVDFSAYCVSDPPQVALDTTTSSTGSRSADREFASETGLYPHFSKAAARRSSLVLYTRPGPLPLVCSVHIRGRFLARAGCQTLSTVAAVSLCRNSEKALPMHTSLSLLVHSVADSFASFSLASCHCRRWFISDLRGDSGTRTMPDDEEG